MTRTRAELLLLAALLAAAWLALGRRPAAPAAGSHAGRVAGAADARPVDGGLAERARAMRERLAAPPARAEVRRNPFAFAPSRGRAAAAPAPDAAAPVPVDEPRQAMALSGIAEDGVNGSTSRTAVLSCAGQLIFAREGDRVLARYLVLRIAADAVQFRDLERGEVFTLAFR
jgi:hypothetical protein